MNTIFADTDTVQVDSDRIAQLRSLAMQSPRRRSRLCLHRGHDDRIQKMVITCCRESYIPPHRQVEKKKHYQMIQGAMIVAFFSEQGKIDGSVKMGGPESGSPFLYHFMADRWHTIFPLSEFVTYLEVIPGPYLAQNTEYAPWAPSPGDARESIDAFVARTLTAALETTTNGNRS